MLRCSSRMPPAEVYLVRPAFIAATAARLMLSGVSKSGSPAPESQAFTPRGRRASAACIAAIGADDCMRPTLWETGNAFWEAVDDVIAGVDISEGAFIVGRSFLSCVFRLAEGPRRRLCRRVGTLL